MDTAQWPQEIVVKPLEEIVTNTCQKPQQQQLQQPPTAGAAGGERKARPEKDQAVNCPRCNSTNTKFCYYNNYSLTQPRYFCKGCRRYWTEGGSLRNIPVGGGSRKNKRSHSSSISSSSDLGNNHSVSTQPATKKHLSDHHHHLMSMSQQQGLTGQNPKFLEATQQDLNLGFPPHGMIRTNFTDLIHNIGNSSSNNKSSNNNNPLLVSSCSAMSTSSLDLIRNSSNNGNSSNSSFMGFPVHNQDPTSGGFSMQDHYKPCNTNTTLLGFSLDHHHNNGFHGGFQGGETGGEGGDDVNGRHLFPFEDLKLPVSSSSASVSVDVNEQQKRESGGDAAATSGGYWTGMLSGGSWC
ncbi:hypothetical protein CARUB_v10005156mg [Capsella rubella]|uniref:Dof zinc finger protein n=1 Tax=Capsella rubella TaxID=81985 RepID=R0F588_9BRAS|nr:dof zinc finger protein DOF4.6 [Capsella rubella]EOA16932.1 hypothetical protein CARUB_v10005156mg [Capsella rubella]